MYHKTKQRKSQCFLNKDSWFIVWRWDTWNVVIPFTPSCFLTVKPQMLTYNQFILLCQRSFEGSRKTACWKWNKLFGFPLEPYGFLSKTNTPAKIISRCCIETEQIKNVNSETMTPKKLFGHRTCLFFKGYFSLSRLIIWSKMRSTSSPVLYPGSKSKWFIKKSLPIETWLV